MNFQLPLLTHLFRIFPPQHIPGVGTLQDPGPLENDPLITAMTQTTQLYPHLEEPDYIVSFGTGEPETDTVLCDSKPKQKWGGSPWMRLALLVREKLRDKKTRQIFANHPRYLRFDTQLPNGEPRLDDVDSTEALESHVSKDVSLERLSDEFSKRAVASLFFFELARKMDWFDGKYEGQGSILCELSPGHPAFQPLMDYLRRTGAKFYLDKNPVPSRLGNGSYFDIEGHFRLPVELKVDQKFSIDLKQGDDVVFPISASPLSVQKLECLQGLTAFFGRPNHRKRSCSRGESNQVCKRVRR